MIDCSLWPGLMLSCLMIVCRQITSRELGLFGLGAAESALADAYWFAVDPVPERGLVLGRGCARFGIVRLGGIKVRKVRSNAADALDAGDVFMCRDLSIAPVLDVRRRVKAVMDVLDSMIRSGVTLARSIKLTVQWEEILRAGLVHLVTLVDLQSVQGGGLGEFRRIAGDFHCTLSDFVH